VLLHLCQPTEPRLEELGRVRPNGGMMYLGVDEFQSSLSRTRATQEEPRRFLKLPKSSKKKKKKFVLASQVNYSTSSSNTMNCSVASCNITNYSVVSCNAASTITIVSRPPSLQRPIRHHYNVTTWSTMNCSAATAMMRLLHCQLSCYRTS